MRLIELLKAEASWRGLVEPDRAIDPAQAFYLVRDMPYRRASDRHPETIIAEWRGTCSGKHYLLQGVFAELGLPSRLIACTTSTPVEESLVPDGLLNLYRSAGRRFVDIHNYLVLELPGGTEMIVDATWPLSAAGDGLVSNEDFILGQDQRIAADPIESWTVPPDQDPQAFKDELLRSHFTRDELAFREEVIRTLGEHSK